MQVYHLRTFGRQQHVLFLRRSPTCCSLTVPYLDLLGASRQRAAACVLSSFPPLAWQACADKLDRELSTYGCPPVFPGEDEAIEVGSMVVVGSVPWVVLFNGARWGGRAVWLKGRTKLWRWFRVCMNAERCPDSGLCVTESWSGRSGGYVQ